MKYELLKFVEALNFPSEIVEQALKRVVARYYDLNDDPEFSANIEMLSIDNRKIKKKPGTRNNENIISTGSGLKLKIYDTKNHQLMSKNMESLCVREKGGW